MSKLSKQPSPTIHQHSIKKGSAYWMRVPSRCHIPIQGNIWARWQKKITEAGCTIIGGYELDQNIITALDWHLEKIMTISLCIHGLLRNLGALASVKKKETEKISLNEMKSHSHWVGPEMCITYCWKTPFFLVTFWMHEYCLSSLCYSLAQVSYVLFHFILCCVVYKYILFLKHVSFASCIK